MLTCPCLNSSPTCSSFYAGGSLLFRPFFTEGKGKKTEGNPWILFSYLNKRSDVGLLQISKKAIRDAIQTLVDKGIILKKKETGFSPYLIPEDFETKKKEFLTNLK